MIIDGKAIAASIRDEIREDVQKFKLAHGIVPGLAVIIVGQRPDSQTYVSNKKKAALEVGFDSTVIQLPDTISEEYLCSELNRLVKDKTVHGILVQLPLPEHINESHVLALIPPEKDVDGFGVSNMGAIAMKGQSAVTAPCTALGVVELLSRSQIEPQGKHVVVLGRSNIVGLPVSLLLLKLNATVTVCHSKTLNLSEIVNTADILVAAIGQPEFVQADWLKQGVVVIDVGIHRVNGKLVGDVDFHACVSKCSAITPVPGGVGPMTIAMLLRNCLALATYSVKQSTY